MVDKKLEPLGEVILQGLGVSPGVAVGEVVLFAHEGASVPERTIAEKEVPSEISRFDEALVQTRRQISEIQRKVDSALGKEHAGIFDAHLLVVDDRYFIDEVIREVREKKKNVESIIHQVAGRYIAILSNVEDDYLRERAVDVRDVTRRIIKNLAGEVIDRMDQIERPCIAIAQDFSPSDTAGMNPDIVHAFATDQGSSTSHAAIMARALEVPAVVGLHDITAQLSTGETILIDGTKGRVVIRPTSERLLSYARKAEEYKTILCELGTLKDKLPETKDGHCVPIAANIELPCEVDRVEKYGAKGVGLFRTEFLFLNEDQLPDEEEQARVYAEVADQCAPESVIIRTLDLGGDKLAAGIRTAPELNPFLGWRAIRYCLAHPHFFKIQLRAILRAGAGRNISMMYPMISCLSEVLKANAILEECRNELREEGIAYAETLSVGVMIEIPSAALTADLIAPHVDFFSIGTNDLIQYTLAVDRGNENVAHLYLPTHAAVLKLIHQVVHAGHACKIPVSVCGEMAASPELVPLLIGLGVDDLSITPPSVPMIKDVIRNLKYSECKSLAKDALRSGIAESILEECRALLAKRSPEILELTS